MTPQQRKFGTASRRCKGDAVCMSNALSGYGKKKTKKSKKAKRKGMGILPHSAISGGTTCTKLKKVYSKVYGKKVDRCAVFSFKGKGKRGIWTEKYAKAGYTIEAPNKDATCKGYKTVGRGCKKPRCASFTTKVGAKTAEGAKTACRKAKGVTKKKGKGKKKR